MFMSWITVGWGCLFSQSLGVDTLPPPDPKPARTEFNYSVGFKDLNGKHSNELSSALQWLWHCILYGAGVAICSLDVKMPNPASECPIQVPTPALANTDSARHSVTWIEFGVPGFSWAQPWLLFTSQTNWWMGTFSVSLTLKYIYMYRHNLFKYGWNNHWKTKLKASRHYDLYHC